MTHQASAELPESLWRSEQDLRAAAEAPPVEDLRVSVPPVRHSMLQELHLHEVTVYVLRVEHRNL